MTLSTGLRDYIAACFTGLWVQSHEHEDALAEIAELCREEEWRLAVWDIAQGLQLPGQNGDVDTAATDPLAAISAINALANPDSSALLVLKNFHSFVNSPEVSQTLAQQIAKGKQNRTFVIVLSPLVRIPTELEKLFTVIEHELPGRTQLEEVIRGVATESGELPEDGELDDVLDAAGGLTRLQCENAVSLSLVREGRVGVSRMEALCERMFGKQVSELSSFEASALIDQLKAIKSGDVDLADVLGEGAAA